MSPPAQKYWSPGLKLETIELLAIRDCLEHCVWSQKLAAAELGISRRKMGYRVRQLRELGLLPKREEVECGTSY